MVRFLAVAWPKESRLCKQRDLRFGAVESLPYTTGSRLRHFGRARRRRLLTRYRHSKIIGRQSVFTHAMRDPLFLLTTELPRIMVLELSERSRAWPADLRRRWTYAAAVGAVGGFFY
jgi:hypothetical protein